MRKREPVPASRWAKRLVVLALAMQTTAAIGAGWCTAQLSRAQDALAKAEATHGAQSHAILDAVLAVADACDLVEDYEAAKEAYTRAATLQKQGLKDIRNDLMERMQKRIVALNGLGAACLNLRQFEEAEKAYNTALANARLSLSPTSREVKVARNGFSLARAYFMRFEAAVKLYEGLLESCEAAFGPEDPEIGRVLEAQVDLYKAMHDLPAAEDAAQQLVDLRRRGMPPHHPLTASALNRLASVRYENDRMGEALPLLQEALEIRKKAFGADHVKVAISMNNIAALLREMGNDKEAETYEAAARKRTK